MENDSVREQLGIKELECTLMARIKCECEEDGRSSWSEKESTETKSLDIEHLEVAS